MLQSLGWLRGLAALSAQVTEHARYWAALVMAHAPVGALESTEISVPLMPAGPLEGLFERAEMPDRQVLAETRQGAPLEKRHLFGLREMHQALYFEWTLRGALTEHHPAAAPPLATLDARQGKWTPEPQK